MVYFDLAHKQETQYRICDRMGDTLTQAPKKTRRIEERDIPIQEENEENKRLADAAQEEAEQWKIKFEAERILRRTLNAKILDMQVRRNTRLLTMLCPCIYFLVRFDTSNPIDCIGARI